MVSPTAYPSGPSSEPTPGPTTLSQNSDNVQQLVTTIYINLIIGSILMFLFELNRSLKPIFLKR